MNLTIPGMPVLKNYIPQLYSPKILMDFYEKSVLTKIFNTDYEGLLKQKGDSVIIRKNATIDVNPWQDGQRVDYQEASTEDKEMKIDHASIWAFKVSPLKMQQTDLKSFVDAWTLDASKQTQKYTEITCINKILASTLAEGNYGAHAGVDSENYNLGTIDNPVIITNEKSSSTEMNVTDYITNMYSVLDEQNVTDEGKEVNFVCPKIYVNKLNKSELKRADIVGSSNTTLHFGKKAIGNIQGADVIQTGYMRPIVNAAGKKVWPVLICTKEAASFALTFTHTWASELEGEVAYGHRGVSVFGCELIEPRALAVGYVGFN